MKRAIAARFVQIERRKRVSREDFSELSAVWVEKLWKSAWREQIPMKKLAGRVANSFLTPKDAPVPDCRTCGLCCSVLPSVQLTRDDPTSPENFWEITIEGRKGEQVIDKVLRRNAETGNCAALSGEVGKFVKCEIYEDRPQACRSLEAGSDGCHALRRAFRAEPPLTQIETIEALMKIFEGEPSQGSARIINSEISLNAGTGACEINVWLQSDEKILVHEFDAEKENWLEGDFLGLTLAEARELTLSGQST